MIKNGTIKSKKYSLAASVVAGAAVTTILSIAGALLGAILLNGEKISENAVFPVAVGTWMIAAFFGILVSINLSGEAKVLAAVITSVCYLVILLGIGILFFDTDFKGFLSAFLSVIAANVPAALILINKKPGKKKNYRYKIK